MIPLPIVIKFKKKKKKIAEPTDTVLSKESHPPAELVYVSAHCSTPVSRSVIRIVYTSILYSRDVKYEYGYRKENGG